ncbi:GGDEF domain-containing protein [Motilibacter aurantiacus]|uniref:GGDEF domain-containing protein n=1 Tax=Motilibacter aurantiacus TaxID=2714955 RepID=UPI00140971B5|nr:GGDEF domain-containing protein [Motilibacter aurantiacus]NHC44025.1 GGDEF domain-containing protein [Motilibacter aurantiacus]
MRSRLLPLTRPLLAVALSCCVAAALLLPTSLAWPSIAPCALLAFAAHGGFSGPVHFGAGAAARQGAELPGAAALAYVPAASLLPGPAALLTLVTGMSAALLLQERSAWQRAAVTTAARAVSGAVGLLGVLGARDEPFAVRAGAAALAAVGSAAMTRGLLVRTRLGACGGPVLEPRRGTVPLAALAAAAGVGLAAAARASTAALWCAAVVVGALSVLVALRERQRRETERLHRALGFVVELSALRSAGDVRERLRHALTDVVEGARAYFTCEPPPPGEPALELPAAGERREWLLVHPPGPMAPAVADVAATMVDAARRSVEGMIERSRLHHAARHDGLTGLANRGQLDEVARRELARARREGGHLALLYLDLDGFKQVNDEYGHRAGDELLRQVADRMRAALREGDLPARIGGDEFCVLLTTSVRGPGDVEAAVQRLVEQVSSPYLVDGRVVTVGVSIGAAGPEDGAHDFEAMLRAADAKMYAVKRGADGRRRPPPRARAG